MISPGSLTPNRYSNSPGSEPERWCTLRWILRHPAFGDVLLLRRHNPFHVHADIQQLVEQRQADTLFAVDLPPELLVGVLGLPREAVEATLEFVAGLTRQKSTGNDPVATFGAGQ